MVRGVTLRELRGIWYTLLHIRYCTLIYRCFPFAGGRAPNISARPLPPSDEGRIAPNSKKKQTRACEMELLKMDGLRLSRPSFLHLMFRCRLQLRSY